MNLLLDTHIAIWAITEDPRLTRKARDLIEDSDNRITVSSASIWEISIKRPLGRSARDNVPFSSADALAYFRAAEFDILDVSAAHAVAVEALPSLHADPFDRILVAQALTEPLRLLTRDPKVAAYSDTIILA